MLGVTPKGTGLNGTPSRCADPGNVLIQKPAATTALGQNRPKVIAPLYGARGDAQGANVVSVRAALDFAYRPSDVFQIKFVIKCEFYVAGKRWRFTVDHLVEKKAKLGKLEMR